MHLQVQVVARSNIVVATLTTTKALVDTVQRLVNMNQSVDDSGSVNGWHSEFAVCDQEGPRRIVRGEIHVADKDRFKSVIRLCEVDIF